MGENKSFKGIERGRASFAFDCALKGKKLGKEKAQEYKSYVNNVPVYIKTNGLGAALAFVYAKKSTKKKEGEDNTENAYSKIYQQTCKYINQYANHIISDVLEDDMLKTIISLDSSHYRALTVEVLAFFNWLRRFANGLIIEEKK